MKIEKSIEINRNSGSVFNYLKTTTNQDKFSVWNMSDPGMKKDYLGEDGKVGFIYKWDSANKNTGAGEQEITSIEEGRSIAYALRFHRPMKNTGISRFLVENQGQDRSLVRWTFESPSKFPMLLFSPIFRKMLGRDLASSLRNLKGILEAG